jgi:hypothetical protein
VALTSKETTHYDPVMTEHTRISRPHTQADWIDLATLHPVRDETDEEWMRRRSREICGNKLPAGYVVTHHKFARKGLVWKGTHPRGWTKAMTKGEVEDFLFLVAADEIKRAERTKQHGEAE